MLWMPARLRARLRGPLGQRGFPLQDDRLLVPRARANAAAGTTPRSAIAWPYDGAPIALAQGCGGHAARRGRDVRLIAPAMSRPRILVTGANGQVGAELAAQLRPLGDVIAVDRATLDLADPDALRRGGARAEAGPRSSTRPRTPPSTAPRPSGISRYAVNATAPGILAAEAKRLSAVLIHYSTDYVFDGATRTPYAEDDPAGPLGVYGATKLAGEQAIARRRRARADAAHQLGLRIARQQLPAHDPAARRDARRTADRRRPDRRAELVPRARRGHRADRRRRVCPRWPSAPDSTTCRRRGRRPGTTSPARSSATSRHRASSRSRPPSIRCRRADPASASWRRRSSSATFGFALPPWRDALAACVAGPADPG